MRGVFLTLLLLFFILERPCPATAAEYSANPGLKYLQNYTAREYDHYPQNWCVIQDDRGIIYVGNQAGLLEFDGVSWRIHYIPNWSVRSLASAETGTIFIGGNNEIGFLTSDEKGNPRYVSLVDHLKDNHKNFSIVRGTHATNQGIFFETEKFLFRWNSRQFNAWETSHSFIGSFYVKGKLFLQQENVGLMQMQDDSLQLIPGGEIFSRAEIFMMVPYDTAGQKFLVATRTKGLYTYENNTLVPFPTQVDNYLKEKQLYHGIGLCNGDFALATLRGGLVIIDSRGKLKHIFDKKCGVLDDDVKHVFQDKGGNLWLALHTGISKIEYASPFSIHGDRTGLPGAVVSVVQHQQQLYAGTSSGLYFLARGGKFRPVPGITTTCWSLLSSGDSLLAASDDGVFQVKSPRQESPQKIIPNPAFALLQSPLNPRRIWVGTHQGLVSLYLEPTRQQWEKEYHFENIPYSIRTIVETEKGRLWLGTLTKGVLTVDFPSGLNSPLVSRYDDAHGLPPQEINVFEAAGHVMFATERGIFRFDEANKIFIPDKTLGNEFADGSKNIFRIVEDKNKNIWFHSGGQNIRAIPQAGGGFTLNHKPFLRIPIAQVNVIYPDPGENITWFGGYNGLVGYNTRVKKDYEYDFPALIRKVQLINGMSLVFAGNSINTDNNAAGLLPGFSYKDRNLRFEFAAPFFEDESRTTYQCLLQGYDDDWSPWSRETKKDYTNLDSGDYIFRVRARNVYHHLSREGIYRFRILPPWYKTWWAFLIYGCGALLIVALVVRWRSWKLVQEKRHLEHIIKQRTAEINDKNILLQQQTRQLQEQSQKLADLDQVKSRFFANVSHEFRTPLTLIMGPLEQILAQPTPPPWEELEKSARVMLRNSRRLLHLVNQLLDLSKLESGKMKLQASPQNMTEFLKSMLASFESLARQNKLTLAFRAEEDIILYIDPDKMEKVIVNLLSNAIKFSSAGGEITLSVKGESRKQASFPRGCVEISVSDTGVGIPAHQLLHIFDRFYQGESTPEMRHKGAGIGLALTKELVLLHHGEILVRSEGREKGAEFILRLPLGKEHLEPEEIADEPQLAGEQHREPPGYVIQEIEEQEEQVTGEELLPEEKLESAGEERHLILVVEDNKDMRDYIKSSLEASYDILEAADGKEGIAKAREVIPDLIISDIMMPEPDGYELCRVLKKDINTSHIPVILLTAKTSEPSIIKGWETGADDYIIKPFSAKILTARIKNLIEQRRQLQLKRRQQMPLEPVEISVPSLDETFYKELQEIIEKNLSEPEFNVEQLHKKLYMSRTSLYKKILALTGETPTQFMRSYRLKRAAQLLKANYGNVTEVAFAVGFNNTAYFSKCFKEQFQQMPSRFSELPKPSAKS